jgi:predicted flap endonuclease-1-like 5' DNA nuclease
MEAGEEPEGEAEVGTVPDESAATSDGTDAAALQEKVEFVEGIGVTYGAKLNEAGIVTALDLLRRGATRQGRAELERTTGIAGGLILKWVNHSDLFRIKGVSKQFAELLEAAGVDTVPELAQRNPVNLFTRLSEVNAEKKLVGRDPHQGEVDSWVSQATSLPRIVEY